MEIKAFALGLHCSSFISIINRAYSQFHHISLEPCVFDFGLFPGF